MRKAIDCREHPSDQPCSIKISGETDEEVMRAALDHAMSVHGEKDTPELRQGLKSMLREDPESAK